MKAQECQKCGNKFFHYTGVSLCDECEAAKQRRFQTQ